MFDGETKASAPVEYSEKQEALPPPYPGQETSNPVQAGYPTQSGYTQQQGYPPQPGYPPQSGYPPQPQAGQPPQAQPGYPAQLQAGYPAQPQPVYPQTGYSTPAQPVQGYTSTNTVVVTQPYSATTVMSQPMMPNNTGAIIFSCFVYWCFCCILGLIAFIYAVTAKDSGNVQEAYRKLQLSNRLSIAGVVIGIILWVLSIVMRVSVAASSS